VNQQVVGMISSYKNLNQRDWLWKQTPHPFGVWGNIQMLATADKPDFLLMYQFDFPNTPPSSPWWKLGKKQPVTTEVDYTTLFREVPQERIIYLTREPPLDYNLDKTLEKYQKAQHYCGYISGPDQYAPIPDYMPAIWYHDNSFRDLNELGVSEKQETCCWITSGIDRSDNHRRRLDFLRLLLNSPLKFDLYGRRLPEWAKGKGTVENKWHVMSPYYYNLAIENYADNEWYVSEKLWDALLAWCLPIYYGGSAADKLLPPGSFLRLPSLDEKGLAYIQEVTANLDAWHDAKDAIAEARQIILHKLNLLKWLSDFADKF
jgi:hypothetical protein